MSTKTETETRLRLGEEVECPRCGRISHAWEKNYQCSDCTWPIRPDLIAEPYGYDVLIEKRTGNFSKTTEVRHYKGNEATARRRGRAFGTVVAVVAWSQEQWRRAYGEGPM